MLASSTEEKLEIIQLITINGGYLRFDSSFGNSNGQQRGEAASVLPLVTFREVREPDFSNI